MTLSLRTGVLGRAATATAILPAGRGAVVLVLRAVVASCASCLATGFATGFAMGLGGRFGLALVDCGCFGVSTLTPPASASRPIDFAAGALAGIVLAGVGLAAGAFGAALFAGGFFAGAAGLLVFAALAAF